MSYINRSSDVLEYIAGLNRVISETDSQSSIDQSTLDNNLAMFSNSQYFDFELGHDLDPQQSGFPVVTDSNIPLQDFTFSKFGAYPKIFEPQDTGDDGAGTSVNTTIDPYASPTSPTGCIDSFGIQGKSLSVTSPSSNPDVNEFSRNSAEIDKRRRNTAASARFRIKKKQREQALEKSAKEMSDKVTKLESRIIMLETENKWLKDLITDKNDRRTQADTFGPWKPLKNSKQEKIVEQRIDGVGTEPKS